MIKSKTKKITRNITELPGILIQNRSLNEGYYFSSKNLIKYSNYPRKSSYSVHFVISDNDILESVDDYSNDSGYDKPDVIIHFPKKNMIFTIPYDDLKNYKVSGKQMKDIEEINISFILPENGDLIERTPAMNPAMLQSNTEI
ncbi:hypothetical protein [Lactobacillus panisapium]|uniref:hypothetical protein n=1 Tax=Lactobacillus panisapium TaxID=2012495 RepID=UPI0022E71F32|nr:hypothetical protein [Lactobacillus panisapium]